MINNKKWDIKLSRSDKFAAHSLTIQAMARKLGVLPVTAILLYNRGLQDTDSATKFLKKETEFFHDSFELKDMDKAVERVIDALNNKEKIVIYGDYDVDGVTSVSTLYLYLKEKGGNVDYYIPNRNGEGYGINITAIDNLAKSGVDLIITVDTGITAYNEVEYIKSLGIDIVITDHHECYSDIPVAAAIVNPKRVDCDYPFKDLAGVGVVFKLLCALEQQLNRISGEPEKNYISDICYKYADIVAIGTVADVMPLVDENRLIVSLGLKMIENTARPGLLALLEQSGAFPDPKSFKATKKKKISSSLIGYVLAPRINAAGRISNASKAVELFLTESEFEANRIALELCETNRERQNEENTIIEEAYKKIEQEHDFENDLVIVLSQDNWHHGIIGIVSSRITEHYNLPSILISFEDDIGKGSGRSIKGMNLVDALMSCNDCLLKYGGHELAAGLSIERNKLHDFKKKINDYARTHLNEEDLMTSILIDCELNTDDVTLELANQLYWLEPYGISNSVPVFIMRDLKIADIIPIGNNRHTKFNLMKDSKFFTAVYFGTIADDLNFVIGDYIDVVFNLDINDFQNTQNVQMIVKDIDHNADYYKTLTEQKQLYEDIKTGRKIAKDENVVPAREDFVSVYQYIKQKIRKEQDIISIHEIECNIGGKNNEQYVKIKFIIDILYETNIIGIENTHTDDCYKFKLNYVKNKINLDRSSIYKKLKSRQEKS